MNLIQAIAKRKIKECDTINFPQTKESEAYSIDVSDKGVFTALNTGLVTLEAFQRTDFEIVHSKKEVLTAEELLVRSGYCNPMAEKAYLEGVDDGEKNDRKRIQPLIDSVGDIIMVIQMLDERVAGLSMIGLETPFKTVTKAFKNIKPLDK